MYLSIKLLYVWLYSAVLSPLSQVVIQSQPSKPPEYLLIFFVLMMFVPEVALVFSKRFSNWIRSGIENSDGVFSKEDLKDLVILYGSLWSLRAFLFMSWSMVFYDVEIPFYIYLTPLIGSFGISGLPILKHFISKK